MTDPGLIASIIMEVKVRLPPAELEQEVIDADKKEGPPLGGPPLLLPGGAPRSRIELGDRRPSVVGKDRGGGLGAPRRRVESKHFPYPRGQCHRGERFG